MAVASAWVACLGYRGRICDPAYGDRIPERVRTDPQLVRRANALVRHWCTGAAVLSLAPLPPLVSVLLSDGGRSLSLWGLLVYAGYGMVVVVIGSYPFEKIRHLPEGGSEPGQD